MTRKSTGLLARSKYVIKNEGLIAFLRRAFSFLRYQLFFYRTYYLHETRLDELDKAADTPKVSDFSFHVITTNRQVDELTNEGFEFRPWYPVYVRRLDKGATAFCGFAGKELVHISWCAFTEEAMKSLGEPPLKVDFANNEAASGDYWTNSAYRGKLLAHYASRKRQQYMRDSGRVITRGAIAKDNAAAQRVIRLRRTNIHAEGRHLKILWWQSWKEKPIHLEETP